jgi:hypothetical protein
LHWSSPCSTATAVKVFILPNTIDIFVRLYYIVEEDKESDMKFVFVILSVSVISGCSNSPEWAQIHNPNSYGYKKHDPCITCGEGWSFIPNERFAAQKSADR